MLPIAGTYTLSIVGPTEELGYTGDLDVLDGLTIVGLGPGRTVIDAAGIDGVFDFSPNEIHAHGGGSFVNSTVSGHIGTGSAVLVTGDLAIMGCTLADPAGNALCISSGVVELANTIIVGTCGSCLPGSIVGNLESPGHTCNLGSNDLEDVPGPVVSALGWFGGPTPVHQPLAGSLVIDHPWAEVNCPLRDQRQVQRPRDGDGGGGADCDIGAVELFGPGEIFVDGLECGFTTAWSVVAS